MSTHKINKIKEEINNLEESILQAKKNNKVHFANRLKIIMKKKKDLLNNYNDLYLK